MNDSTPMEEVDGCVCEKETAKALLVKLPSGIKVWVPKSCVSDDSDSSTGKLVVARWWAEKQGVG